MQEDDGPETSNGRRWRWGRRRRVAPRGYPREGAGKFFPLGCRQKGNYFNCGQPRSTKLHPVFLLSLSLSLCLCPSLALFPRPRVRLLTLILSLSYAVSRVLSFSPAPFLFYVSSESTFHPLALLLQGFLDLHAFVYLAESLRTSPSGLDRQVLLSYHEILLMQDPKLLI